MDNGVSLRLRRQVTAISEDSHNSGNGTLTVEMEHWEPASYIDSKLNVSETSSTPRLPASITNRIASFIAASLVLCAVFFFLAHVISGIPFLSPHLSRAQAAACAFVLAFSYVAVQFDGPAALSHVRLNNCAGNPKPSASASFATAKMAKAAPMSIGSGGNCVPVAEMALGGSGFITAVGGRVVEKETVRTRQVNLYKTLNMHPPFHTRRHMPSHCNQIHRELRWWLQRSHCPHGRRRLFCHQAAFGRVSHLSFFILFTFKPPSSSQVSTAREAPPRHAAFGILHHISSP